MPGLGGWDDAGLSPGLPGLMRQGRKILTENIFMFYKSIGAVNTFCVILLTHEAQIVLTMAVKYLCDIGQQ